MPGGVPGGFLGFLRILFWGEGLHGAPFTYRLGCYSLYVGGVISVGEAQGGGVDLENPKP